MSWYKNKFGDSIRWYENGHEKYIEISAQDFGRISKIATVLERIADIAEIIIQRDRILIQANDEVIKILNSYNIRYRLI